MLSQTTLVSRHAMSTVDQIRSFNRFYTREIGLLAEHLPSSELSLAEARVLYELAQSKELTAADIIRTLGMDKAHVSRIVARFRGKNLVKSRTSPQHAKQKLLSLTATGRRLFSAINRGTNSQVEELLARIPLDERPRLLASMQTIQALLKPEEVSANKVQLRSPRVGDLGWITSRQAILYEREYGWDWTYEALVARILGEFVAHYDANRDDAWIAETAGNIVGSVFLMKTEDPHTAKLRLLYVEPSARGLGVGSLLVKTCVERARKLGYRTLTLWTNSVLSSARHIYEREGFSLIKEERHRSFGHSLLGQTWTLDLSETTLLKA
jgi:DNA-binding MarR family transcriptional regulator/GNAT superfamily N-acetyltransferase